MDVFNKLFLLIRTSSTTSSLEAHETLTSVRPQTDSILTTIWTTRDAFSRVVVDIDRDLDETFAALFDNSLFGDILELNWFIRIRMFQ